MHGRMRYLDCLLTIRVVARMLKLLLLSCPAAVLRNSLVRAIDHLIWLALLGRYLLHRWLRSSIRLLLLTTRGLQLYLRHLWRLVHRLRLSRHTGKHSPDMIWRRYGTSKCGLYGPWNLHPRRWLQYWWLVLGRS